MPRSASPGLPPSSTSQHRFDAPFWPVFICYTVGGSVVAFVVRVGLLWVFRQTDDAGFD